MKEGASLRESPKWAVGKSSCAAGFEPASPPQPASLGALQPRIRDFRAGKHQRSRFCQSVEMIVRDLSTGDTEKNEISHSVDVLQIHIVNI